MLCTIFELSWWHTGFRLGGERKFKFSIYTLVKAKLQSPNRV